MKTIPASEQALLDSGITTLSTCVKITRLDGVVIGITDHDVDLVIGGITYSSKAGHTPTGISGSSDLSVPNLDITGLFEAAGIQEADVAAGKLDYATIEVFLANYQTLTVVARLRKGTFGEITVEEGRYTGECRGLAQLLQQTIGELYSPDCRADLFDMQYYGGARVFGRSRCKLDPAAYTLTGTVSAVSDRRNFTSDLTGQADDYFKYGLVIFTSGENANRGMEVKVYSAGAFELFEPLPGAIQAGDTFEAIAGCDKRITTCRDKFNNVANFRGEPYVPGINALRDYRVRPAEQTS